jgi:hypothetical protein
MKQACTLDPSQHLQTPNDDRQLPTKPASTITTNTTSAAVAATMIALPPPQRAS